MINALSNSQPKPAIPFDLTAVDTPVEVLMLPVADVVTTALCGHGEPAVCTVTKVAEGQTVSYTLNPEWNRSTLKGMVNNVPFELTSRARSDGQLAKVRGDVPGGSLEATLKSLPGGVEVSGTVGSIEYSERLTVMSKPEKDGVMATVEGTVGGQTLTQRLIKTDDPTRMKIEGHLGEMPIDQIVERTPEGALHIHGTIGSMNVEETILKQPIAKGTLPLKFLAIL